MKEIRTTKKENSIRKSNDTHRAHSVRSDRIFLNAIFTYYKKSGRHDLVWRKSITPYRVLVSEIMLQQTQVSRVTPKFIEWMKRYPTLTSLSKASLTDVLLLWQGLGYQRRAKALLAIAQSCSVIPKTYIKLLGLPGIGTYTASAVCAFAYDMFEHPVLETNIRTALIHAYHHDETTVDDIVLYEDLSRLEKCKEVKDVGAQVFYSALMDYGAYLKSLQVSHNSKSKGYVKQKPYKGSLRELRAQTLFAIAHKDTLPIDTRIEGVLTALQKEGFIKQIKNKTKNEKGISYTIL
jgi:A/G-specific adenine glycosylase